MLFESLSAAPAVVHCPREDAGPSGASQRGPAAAEAMAAMRERLEQAFDAHPTLAADAPVARADPAGPADAVRYVAAAREAGVLPPRAEATLTALLAERLRTAETPVDARHRAERAIEWALLAARRRGWASVSPETAADADAITPAPKPGA